MEPEAADEAADEPADEAADKPADEAAVPEAERLNVALQEADDLPLGNAGRVDKDAVPAPEPPGNHTSLKVW